MSIRENVLAVQERIAVAAARAGRDAASVTLVAIAKTTDAAGAREAAAAGVRHIGENRLQEAQRKMKALADLAGNITWHMVGHLQTNKAKAVMERFAILHSVDSVRLGEFLDRCAPRRVPVFLEVNVAGEAAKQGFSPEALPAAMDQLRSCRNLDIRGLMTIAPLAGDPEAARLVFRRLHKLAYAEGLRELSMGMTNDFEAAIAEGATMVRIGRAIFNA
ncbi:MAG: YggS family pyridoxal phosphate-dependent enzyme [Dehalococcoidia bacterium]|nr:YggS family pyridoxal phosphate-dependent enzyme [Dehalococcoidia bacterium]